MIDPLLEACLSGRLPDSDWSLRLPVMMPDEKDQLLALFAGPAKWCRQVEARDADGAPVHYDDPSAVAWDLTGALCRLFGWQRACVLFEQLDRRIHGRAVKRAWPPRDVEMDAMAALQAFNDGAATTFDALRTKLESVPAWRGPHAEGDAGDDAGSDHAHSPEAPEIPAAAR